MTAARYTIFFVWQFLKKIGKDDSTMSGNYNAGAVLLRQKGWYKDFQVWLGEQGIVNLFPIPMFEQVGYKVSTDTDRE